MYFQKLFSCSDPKKCEQIYREKKEKLEKAAECLKKFLRENKTDNECIDKLTEKKREKIFFNQSAKLIPQHLRESGNGI